MSNVEMHKFIIRKPLVYTSRTSIDLVKIDQLVIQINIVK